ncbi:MAG: MFS transporter [Betaproteobacteria bacterium]|nr:MFS transporter [Betaproteobacteria bacterium]MBI2961082.1 MFS transporter [Betaproteobacteria bacterium]
MDHQASTLSGERIPLKLGIMVWLPFACGYFLSYVFRTINAIISPDLVRDLGVNPSELGLLTSAYLISFALFQLPLGVLLDRFGPRRVNASLLVCAAAGAMFFSRAQDLPGLVLARALIGLGVSACLMASIKAFVQWFPMSRLATVNGWLLAAGGLGAVTATAPVEAALRLTDWRGVFAGLAGLAFAIAALVFFMVPDKRDSGSSESLAELLRGLRTVLSNAFFWRLALLLTCVMGGFLSVQGLWFAPWLRDVAGLARPQVAQALLWLALATTFGFALLGGGADRLARSGIAPLASMNVTVAVSMAMFFLIVIGVKSVWIPIVYSFCATGSMLIYPILSAHFAKHLAGRVNTALNLLTFLGAFAAQWGFGAVINLWPASETAYARQGYTTAFGTMLGLTLAAFAWVMLARRSGSP